MFHLQNTPGRTAIVEGKEYLFFSGYSYLGMQHVPGFVELVKEGMDKYGWLFPSSRISNTQLDLFDEFEAKLSQITGQDRTVCFSSGYVAALASKNVLNSFSGFSINSSSAPGSHPAIKMTSPYLLENDYENYTRKLIAFVNETGTDLPIFIALNSVDPLTAMINDFSFLNEIEKPIICLIDDSHGIGIIGKNGSGVKHLLPEKKNIKYAFVYSLSKALGLQGGAVSCSKLVAQQLRKDALYTASNTVSPALAYAFLKGEKFYEQQEEKLQKNIQRFSELTNNRFSGKDGLPIFILPSTPDDKKLSEAGIIISSFAYPDPAGEKINRIVLNALHTEEDLQRLADALL